MRSVDLAVAAAALLVLQAIHSPLAHAQDWGWRDNGYVERPARPFGYWNGNTPGWQNPGFQYQQPGDARRDNAGSPQGYNPTAQPQSGALRDGGERPNIEPVAPPIRPFPYAYPANSIVIDSRGKQLYFVLPGGRAYAYVISVGREGFDWFGSETISRKQLWPDWHPPAEMRARDPSLPEKMTGGLKNPLGAMALYLGTTLYRIHGTNDERTLGQAQSSGCFRMMNASVLHLASMVDVGTTVHVVKALDGRGTVGNPRISTNDARSGQPLNGQLWNGQQATGQAPPQYRAGGSPSPRWADDRYDDWNNRPYQRPMYDRWR